VESPHNSGRRALGYSKNVVWQDDEATVSIGWGAIANVHGVINDEAVILVKCRGALGGKILTECRVVLSRLFPEGAP